MLARRRVPVIRQLSAVECGAASLAMILSYHGRATSLAGCRDLCKPGRDGLTAKAIVNAARLQGLRARGYSVESADLQHVSLPAIVHWNFNHFVVLESWSPKRITIVDPAVGRRILRTAEFDEAFTGVVLTFEPGAEFEQRAKEDRGLLRRYARQMLSLAGARSMLVRVVVASLALQALGLVLPLVTRFAVDYVLPLNVRSIVVPLAIGMLLIVAVQASLSFTRAWLLVYLRARLDSSLMTNFLEHLLSLPYGFFQTRSTGDVLMRLNSVGFIREVLTNNTISVALDGLFATSYLLILSFVDPLFAAAAIVLAVLQTSTVLATQRRMEEALQRELAAKAAENGYLVESLSGVAVLKAAGAEEQALDRWSSLFAAQLNATTERGRISAVTDTVMGALRTLSPFLLLWLGVVRVLDGAMTLGTMLAVSSLAAAFLSPVASLIMNGQQLLLVRAHFDRITDVLEAAPEHLHSGHDRIEITGAIDVQNVTFRYDANGPEVLSGISFSARPGQKIAIVGESGSGKSTLASLLLGLGAPERGDIAYDGVSLRSLDLRHLRRQIGVVLQHASIFSGSVRQNIALSNPGTPLEAIHRAAVLAGFERDVQAMPMRYETFVSESGSTLSGGQRQRLAIARALVSEPALLILDEATSHLDVLTEAMVAENLRSLECTRIVIAHRLSTVRDADEILVMSRGRIIERGTHHELLALCGHYAELVAQDESDIDSAAQPPLRSITSA
ncbi:MAG TPA: peptidase domain-containing ABC transporter [Thermoanaerobaculia bacterium]|nr:peptidase domain-containing ABC transporter [Thermoanaerobaculia bacterium]